MNIRTIQTYAQKHPDTFYWRVILPLQTLLLLAYSAPLYGFNALVGPINVLFEPNDPKDSVMGVLAGSFMFLGAGFGALFNEKLLGIAKSPSRLLAYLNIAAFLTFAVGAVACQVISPTLLFLGFALPAGLIFSNIFSLAMRQLMGWASHFQRGGLQSGVTGLVFGLWGAIFSLYGSRLDAALGLPFFLLITGTGILLIGLLATALYCDPPETTLKPTSSQDTSTTKSEVTLNVAGILKLLPYRLFLVFFLLFLIPGFGFKIVVQQFSDNVFHSNAQTSAIMAVAFLLSYGFSRLIFGVLSDRFQTRALYLGFVAIQALSLFVSAITLQSNHSIVFFTVLMCLIGGSFAAGKSLWVLLQLKIYGPSNYNQAVRATLPALGIAGLLGPLSLNFALSKIDMITATQTWFYVMSAALGICFLLMLMLKKVDYDKVSAGQPQPLSLSLTAGDELSRF